MENYIAKILELDAADDFEALIQYADSLPDLEYPICHLMSTKRYRSAYLLTKVMEKTLPAQAVIKLSRCIGAFLTNQMDDERQAMEDVQRLIDRMNEDEQKALYKSHVEPALQHILNEAVVNNDSAKVMRGLDIAKASTPELRRIFDLHEPIRPLDMAAIRRQGYQKSRLLRYPRPPAGVERPQRKVLVAIRELIYPGEVWSRPLDMGPRITAACANYGWESHFYGIQCYDLNMDFLNIYQQCVEHQVDILIMDDHMIEAEYAWQTRRSVFQALRETLPHIKIVGVHFDAWALNADGLASESQPLDLVWEVTSPSLDVWNRPEFFDAQGRSKVLHTQHPHAYPIPNELPPLGEGILFSGGIKGYNWHRAFWSRLITAYQLPVHQRLSSHANDGLPALESYHQFIDGLAQAGCGVNFSMRSDLSRIVTGRCFETIIAGSLLLQEETPDMDYYFVAGEHYIPFTTFAQFLASIHFINNHKDEAEDVRRRGFDFAREHYSDEAIIGYIEAALFYR